MLFDFCEKYFIQIPTSLQSAWALVPILCSQVECSTRQPSGQRLRRGATSRHHARGATWLQWTDNISILPESPHWAGRQRAHYQRITPGTRPQSHGRSIPFSSNSQLCRIADIDGRGTQKALESTEMPGHPRPLVATGPFCERFYPSGTFPLPIWHSRSGHLSPQVSWPRSHDG